MTTHTAMRASRWHQAREQVGAWIEAPRQQGFIVAIIILNALTLGLETVPAIHATWGGALTMLDHVILGIFVLELLCKLFHRGAGFFSSGWNLFDLVIVGVSLFPASGVFSVMRTLRILRALRLLNKMQQLRRIVEGMLRALPGLAWIAMLQLVLFYVFSVLGTSIFGKAHPHLFGNLAITTYSLFELMTLEGWTTTAREVMTTHRYAFLYFIPFLLLASYTLLNLVIGVIISSMDAPTPQPAAEPARETAAMPTDALLAEMRRLRDTIDRLEARLTATPPREPAVE